MMHHYEMVTRVGLCPARASQECEIRQLADLFRTVVCRAGMA
jgi:hypothetical protein